MSTFDFYKKNVSIQQVAEYLGYEINPEKSSKTQFEYKHPEESNVIISSPDYLNHQVYFTRNNDLDKGSVIDFVKNRINRFSVDTSNSIEAVNRVLSDFAKVDYKPAKGKSDLIKSTKKVFDPSKYSISEASIKDLGYLLRSRNLSDQTLKVFLPHINVIAKKNPKKGEREYRNIGFPYSIPGQEGIKGMETVNYGWKQHAEGSDKSNAIWFAPISEGITKNIFIAENAIDAMSFYQLNKHRISEDFAFVSVGGAISKNQIQNLVNTYPHANYHTGFDNDLPGNIYDIKIAAILLGKELSIKKNGDFVEFQTGENRFSLPEGKVTLSNFRTISKWRPSLNVNKSEGKDFNEDLKQTYTKNSNRLKS